MHDLDAIWLAVAHAIRSASVSTVRNRQQHGIICGAIVTITLNNRTAPIATAWHYEHDSAAPRLVTAYPAP